MNREKECLTSPEIANLKKRSNKFIMIVSLFPFCYLRSHFDHQLRLSPFQSKKGMTSSYPTNQASLGEILSIRTSLRTPAIVNEKIPYVSFLSQNIFFTFRIYF